MKGLLVEDGSPNIISLVNRCQSFSTGPLKYSLENYGNHQNISAYEAAADSHLHPEIAYAGLRAPKV